MSTTNHTPNREDTDMTNTDTVTIQGYIEVGHLRRFFTQADEWAPAEARKELRALIANCNGGDDLKGWHIADSFLLQGTLSGAAYDDILAAVWEASNIERGKEHGEQEGLAIGRAAKRFTDLADRDPR